MVIKAYGAFAGDKPLEPIDIERRQPGPHEVQIRHRLLRRLPFRSPPRPLRMGGHDLSLRARPRDCREIVGHVTAVGGEVTKFRVGDTVGVGCLVESCQHCASCEEGLEQFCENGKTLTYTRRRRCSISAPKGASSRKSR